MGAVAGLAEKLKRMRLKWDKCSERCEWKKYGTTVFPGDEFVHMGHVLFIVRHFPPNGTDRDYAWSVRGTTFFCCSVRVFYTSEDAKRDLRRYLKRYVNVQGCCLGNTLEEAK